MFIENNIYSERRLNADNEMLNSFEIIKNDNVFNAFLMKHNGCFAFEKALQFFSFLSSEYDLLNIQSVNSKIRELYNSFNLESEEFFGQDIFGNLFYYGADGIGIFDIESGDKNVIARDFSGFDQVLSEDFEYLTGISYLNKWEEATHSQLKEDERLCPKKPFIIGGEYDIKNLYAKSSIKNWEFNSDLAFQIKNTPDGTNIKLKII